jgi:hypothetical protein
MEDKLKTSTELMESLSKFIDKIDKVNQRYLRSINWNLQEDDDIFKEVKIIEDYLEKSLNLNCPFKKIDMVLNAYKLLVDIVEDISNQKMNDRVDIQFIEEFSGKRRKIN